MAYDEDLAQRIKNVISPFSDNIIEKKMFGGIAFLYKGKMSVGVVKNDLMIRYIDKKYPFLLDRPNVRPMDFTGKPMKEMAYVSADGLVNDEELKQYILMGIEHAESKS
jgi:TfoX/Sxy family transcriptional regulator of competence genes